MRLRVPLLSLAASVVVAGGGATSTASAAPPIDLGPSSAVDVAVEPGGAAHVVASDPATGELRYCLLPRGAAACARQSAIAMPGSGEPQTASIQIDGPRVLVTAVRTGTGSGDGPAVAVSTDGGVSFGAGVRTASGTGLVGGQQTLGPDGALWHAFSAGLALNTVRLATDGSAPTTDAPVAFPDAASAYDDGAIAAVGGTMLAVRGGDQPSFFTHVVGSGGANLRAGWSGASAIDRLPGATWMSVSSLASGSRGAVMTATEGEGLSAAITARRWTGAGFSAPVELYRHAGGSNNAQNGEVAADPAGGLHAVYAGDNQAYVRYSHSTDGGATWGPSHLIEALDRGAPTALRVSAAADGQGFAAYLRDGHAMVVPLEPIVPPVDPVPAPISVPEPAPKPPVVVRPPTTGKQATTTVRVGDSDLVLGLPAGCLAPGNVRVTFRVQARKVKQAKHRKGRVVVKVKRVDFTVDGKRRRTDRKAPFVQTLRLQGLKPGSTHVIRARAELKQKQQGPKRYRTVTRKVKICG